MVQVIAPLPGLPLKTVKNSPSAACASFGGVRHFLTHLGICNCNSHSPFLFEPSSQVRVRVESSRVAAGLQPKAVGSCVVGFPTHPALKIAFLPQETIPSGRHRGDIQRCGHASECEPDKPETRRSDGEEEWMSDAEERRRELTLTDALGLGACRSDRPGKFGTTRVRLESWTPFPNLLSAPPLLSPPPPSNVAPSERRKMVSSNLSPLCKIFRKMD
jgi:hypothetical protein